MVPVEQLVECRDVSLFDSEVQLVREGLCQGGLRNWKFKDGMEFAQPITYCEQQLNVANNVPLDVGVPYFYGYLLAQVASDVYLADGT